MMVWKPDRGLDFEALRLGIERCDPDLLLGFYAEDAELSIVNVVTPHVSPFELRGKAEIAKHLRAIFGQEASHRVEREGVGEEDGVKYREECEYPDGSRVVVETMLEVRSGEIVRQVDVVTRESGRIARKKSTEDTTRSTHPETARDGDPPRDRLLRCKRKRKRRRKVTKRTDIVLSVGTLALVILAVVGMAGTGTLDEFGAWAWDRHHNILSWYIRPLFFLPFCYFAYKRSLFGMVLTLAGVGHQHVLVPGAGDDQPCGGRDAGGGTGVLRRRLDDLEGPLGLDRADQFCGVGPGLLETVARLGAGGHQRGDPDQDRVDVRGHALKRAPCRTCQPPCWAWRS